jgi:hypothetical protein
MAQKVVLKVLTMTDDKTKQKAIEAAADIFGDYFFLLLLLFFNYFLIEFQFLFLFIIVLFRFLGFEKTKRKD